MTTEVQNQNQYPVTFDHTFPEYTPQEQYNEEADNDNKFSHPMTDGPSTLAVDFSWKKFKSQITSKDDPTRPVYIIDHSAWNWESLIFQKPRPGAPLNDKKDFDKSYLETFGEGKLHAISIHADCHVREKHIKMEAMKRWITEYTHFSNVMKTADGRPMQMKWVTKASPKRWNFICLDGDSLPVAKFQANIWAVKKLGSFEFLGAMADREDLREEMIVTGLTLFYCMVFRMNNIFNFFGAFVARTGKYEKNNGGPVPEDDDDDGISGKPATKKDGVVH